MLGLEWAINLGGKNLNLSELFKRGPSQHWASLLMEKDAVASCSDHKGTWSWGSCPSPVQGRLMPAFVRNLRQFGVGVNEFFEKKFTAAFSRLSLRYFCKVRIICEIAEYGRRCWGLAKNVYMALSYVYIYGAMKTIKKLETLETLADLDIDGILEQTEYYTPECFEEHDGQLIAMLNADPKHAFIVGPIERCGWNAIVKYEGKIIARNERNTGWGFEPVE